MRLPDGRRSLSRSQDGRHVGRTEVHDGFEEDVGGCRALQRVGVHHPLEEVVESRGQAGHLHRWDESRDVSLACLVFR